MNKELDIYPFYLDGLQVEFETSEKSIVETISSAKKKKYARSFQSLKNSCEYELQGVSCREFTEPFSSHPLFGYVVFLIQALQGKNTSYKKVLSCLRKALQHPAYALYKDDENHPFIHFLHTLCLASYTLPSLLDSYRPIGDHLADLTYQMIVKESGQKNVDLPLHQFLSDSRLAAKKAGLIDNDYTLRYALKHPRELISALSSKSWAKCFSYFKKFDPKGFAKNTPGAFFEEKLLFSREEKAPIITARTIYSPTPSFGEEIVPEAKAMLQAMENHHLLSSEALQQERYPYLAWVYVNLQDMTSMSERGRSLSLMRLTEQYPHSFYAITVTQDAGLYGHRKSGQIKEKMLQALLDEANFTLEGGKNGYCFPCRSLQEKEQWKRDLVAMIDLIVDLLDEIAKNFFVGQDVEKLCVVFCELVTLAIVRYFHLRCAITLAAARPFAQDISYLITNACKESIDRGGKINALLLLGKGKREPDVIKAAFSCLHARALSVRSRLIKQNRMMQACALLSVVPHDKLQQFFSKIDALVHLFRSEVNLL